MPFDQVEQFARAEDARRACHDPILDVLVKAREWLSDPAHWHKGSMYGNAVSRDRATSTCAIGAVSVCIPEERHIGVVWQDPVGKEVIRLLNAVAPTGKTSIYNDADATTHADVLSLFDRAISARRTSASE